jgi:hypothetical protein
VTLPGTTAAGTHQLRASFVPATTTQSGSDSAVVGVTVDKASSSSALTRGTTAITKNKAATVTVSAPGVPRPTGTVTVTSDGRTVGTATVSADGAGRVTVPVGTFTRGGTSVLSASYAGSGNVSASVSKRMIVVLR